MVWYCFVHLRYVQACSSDVLLSHMCRNQKCCDKLCHFGAYTHMNNFSYNAVLRRYSELEADVIDFL